MTIFEDLRDSLGELLDELLVNEELVKQVRRYRSYTFDVSPLVIITGSGYSERQNDFADVPDITIATVVQFSGAEEEEYAERMLDRVDQALIDAFRVDGTHQARSPWRAVDIWQRGIRPASPFGPGTRYSEFYLRFVL